MRALSFLPLSFVACGLFSSDAPAPTPEGVPPVPTTEATGPADSELFASACDGAGPTGDVQRDPISGGTELVMVPCEWFAYQGTYELWIQPAEGPPTHQLNRLGVGSMDESTGQWTNLEKDRGVGDCGTFERFDVTASAITLVETREQACGDGSEPPNADPTTWPLATDADACEGGKDYFRCEVAGGKVAQLCGAEDGSWLSYQFGRPGEAELVYPPDRSPGSFGAGEQSWVRAQADYVAFERADHRYILVSKAGSGAMGEGDMNNFTGVVVQKDGQELARLPCTSEPVLSGFSGLQQQLSAVGYLD